MAVGLPKVAAFYHDWSALYKSGAISRRTLQTKHLNEIVDDPVMEDARMGAEAA